MLIDLPASERLPVSQVASFGILQLAMSRQWPASGQSRQSAEGRKSPLCWRGFGRAKWAAEAPAFLPRRLCARVCLSARVQGRKCACRGGGNGRNWISHCLARNRRAKERKIWPPIFCRSILGRTAFHPQNTQHCLGGEKATKPPNFSHNQGCCPAAKGPPVQP